jgi:hypothetical protein
LALLKKSSSFAGLLLEIILGAVLLSFGFPIFLFVGGFAAFAALSAMSILLWAAAAVTALTFVRFSSSRIPAPGS